MVRVLVYMAFYQAITYRRQWRLKSEPDMFSGAPFRIGKYISCNRFEEIINSLRYMHKISPSETDNKFFQLIQLEDECNKNMDEMFDPLITSCNSKPLLLCRME